MRSREYFIPPFLSASVLILPDLRYDAAVFQSFGGAEPGIGRAPSRISNTRHFLAGELD